ERDVQRADAAADGRGERALDADEVVRERLDGLVREPRAEVVERLLPRVDLHPADLALAAVGLRHGCVEDPDARAPDVGAGAVTLDERNDRMIGDDELAALDVDLGAVHRDDELRFCHGCYLQTGAHPSRAPPRPATLRRARGEGARSVRARPCESERPKA